MPALDNWMDFPFDVIQKIYGIENKYCIVYVNNLLL